MDSWKADYEMTRAERKALSSVLQRRDWVLGRVEMGNMPKGLVHIPFVGVFDMKKEISSCLVIWW